MKPEGHIALAAVLDAVGLAQGIAGKLVYEAELEIEGVTLPRRLARPEREDQARVRRRLGCELAPAGEAVAAHFIPRAAPEVAVLRQAAHIGEDIRRAAAPEALVALPEVFRAVRAAHGAQLRPQGRDADAEFFVIEAKFHLASLLMAF